MIAFLNGSAVDGFYQFQLDSNFTTPFMCFYALTMFLGFFVTSFGIRVTMSLRTYHPNINRLYCVGIAMWLSLFISKITIFIFILKGYNNSKQSLEEGFAGFELLRISACFRYFYVFYAPGTPLAATVERAFATVHLAEYEKSSRHYVFIITFFTNVSLAVVFTILSVFFKIKLLLVVLIISSYIIICCVLVTFLYRYNLRKIRRLNTYHRDTQYTLSKRFQLRENIRILKVIMNMIYAVLLFILFLLIGLTFPVLLNFDQWIKDPIRSLVDFCLHCNPFIIIPMTILFIPEYKKKAKQALFRRLQMARSSVDTQQSRYKVKAHNEADIYFDQFKKSMVSEEMNYSALFVKRTR